MDTQEWLMDTDDIDDLDFSDYDYQTGNDFFDTSLGFPFPSFQLSDESQFLSPQQQQNNQNPYFNTNNQNYVKQEGYQGLNNDNYFMQIKEEPRHQTHSFSYVPQPLPQTPIKPPPPKNLSATEVDLVIESQPPVEVRTRTPSEIRTFSVSARVVGNWRALGATMMNVSLWYSQSEQLKAELVKKDILGGTKTVPILPDGTVSFDNLSISESSTKHKEREFFLQLVLLRNDGHELVYKKTRNFYAYSHKKVLQRRGSVKLRTLNKAWGRISGGEQMHVIGSPFIPGPALALIVRTPYGDVYGKPLEYYSDSVLFFELPACPLPDTVQVTANTEIKCQILVTNDGRTYSNPLDFSYIADSDPSSIRS